MSALDTSSGRLTTLAVSAGPYHDGQLRVASFRCLERMSHPFSLTLNLSSGVIAPADIEVSLVGQPATLWIPLPDAPPRAIRGITSWVETRGALLHDRHAFRLGIAPRLWLLTRRKGSRIFQDQTVLEVIARVLTEGAVAHRFEITSAYPKRAYCVQYQETDFAFVARLCAEEGLFYIFDHVSEGDAVATEVVVFGDHPSSYRAITGDPVLTYRESEGPGALSPKESHVQRFLARRKIRPTSVLMSDYDFKRPLLHLSATAATPQLGGEVTSGTPEDRERIYDHHGGYEENDVTRPVAAGVRLEQHRRSAQVGRGRSQCRRLASGARFTLEDHDADDLNGDYLVTRVEHTGFAQESPGKDHPLYANRFECVPADVRFRPRRPEERLGQVVETATVVGPGGQEIYTDEFGRIKVQFHWDLDGKRDERSSCWVRVSQAWAGSGWGAQFIPRIGMEVLVAFLGGDTDRPIVTGCLYNSIHQPPFFLPTQKTRSGIVTQSTLGGGGFNELSFEDDKDREQIRLHAQRDLDEEVRRRHTTLVGEDQRIEVRGEQHNAVTGDQRERVGGSRHGDIHGDQTEHVYGKRTVRVERDQTSEVGGNHAVRVMGDSKEVVTGDAVRFFRDGYTLQIDGQASTTVGAHGDAGKSDFYVFGDQVTGAEGHLTLVAKKSITLQCGDSVISLTPEGLKIGAKVLALAGSEGATMKGKGPALNLGEEAEIVAKTIKIFSKNASLELSDDAHLRGKKVLLNCDTVKPPEVDSEMGRKKTKPLKVKLSDVALAAYANKTYKLNVDGNLFEGTTNASGTVEQEIPETAESATLFVWLEDYPEGPRQQWNLRLKELAPADALPGAMLRLRNLGYYLGPINDTMKELTEAAITSLKTFQKDHSLETTGKLDPTSAAKLKEVYGH